MIHFFSALALLSFNAISRVMCLRIASVKGGNRADSKNNEVCDSSQMRHIIDSIKTGVSYTFNSCIDEPTWNSIRDGNEDTDFEDIHEFVPMKQLVQFKSNKTNCKKTLLPTLLYLGVNHGGSTTIAGILDNLPDWSFGSVKEHRYFTGTAVEYVAGVSHSHKDRSQYEKHFHVGCDVQQTFDASPFYWALGNEHLRHNAFKTPPGKNAIQEVKDTLGPDVKFVLTIKDPVDWLASMQNSYAGHWFGNPEAENLTCYADSLEGWLSVFPPENFLFLQAPDLFVDIPGTIKTIAEFANMPIPTEVPLEAATGRRRNSKKPSLQERIQFHAKHDDCKKRLEVQTGLKFNWEGSKQ